MINISSAWHTDVDGFEDVVNEATNVYNCIIVASSGNVNSAIDYPAAYDNVIVVGATDQNDERRSSSNFGPQLDVVAPSHVYTTDLNGGYLSSFTGTSAAAPHVSGLAALIRSVYPNLPWYEVRDLILITADWVEGMVTENGHPLDFTDYYGHGRINAFCALAPPVKPQNFTVTGNIGDNPTSSWSPNTEPDLDGYNLYKNEAGSGWALLQTLDKNITFYTDNSVTIGSGGKFSSNVCYKVTAFDITEQESPYTNQRCKPLGSVSKQMTDFEIIPDEYALHLAFPNPFNPTTAIHFDLPERSRVSMIIYDVLGRTIKTLVQNTIEPGFHDALWNGKDDKGNPVPTGMYIYRFSAFSEESETQFHKSNKLVLIK